ncbi:MAG: translesion DNA synthesis-associated protein ImuA [Giesbergeria sp.]
MTTVSAPLFEPDGDVHLPNKEVAVPRVGPLPRSLPAHVAEALWRGTELGGKDPTTVSTGFAALDAELPGGGWPTRSLTELLTAQSAICEWRLLGPAIPKLTSERGRLYLIAPPKEPHAGALAQLGASADQLVWIEAATPADRLWATEQVIKADPAGAILSWLPQARPEQIRRLQVQAHGCEAPVFLFRPVTALCDASSAPLRLAIALGAGWHLEVRIPKRRGASLDRALQLSAMPGQLAHVLPPRLITVPLPRPVAVLSCQEVADARALGRTASHSAAAFALSLAH